ncbi:MULTISPECIES: adenylyltransferase/cytidyltransferase family protein [unclassified Enterococcus]|jgi:glycerol-3-phosphate cytidylyltransferase|uniref:adenylyltransferase/cytidyltransferase family protein n=1 Tax=unclassified Enterococcus TaxID=2608891 RepID=UPI000353940D|nr:cytidyltransferase domain protein [Enterococcus faecalis 13-SD-W-01]
MKKYRIGYTQGVFDMFHIGHLNLINQAKEYCDFLIVAVNSDELVKNYKNKQPVINEEERRNIVQNIKAVDQAEIATTLDKKASWEEFSYDAIFVGDDWAQDARWIKTKEELNEQGVDVVFLPYTKDISSTQLRLKKEFRLKEV